MGTRRRGPLLSWRVSLAITPEAVRITKKRWPKTTASPSLQAELTVAQNDAGLTTVDIKWYAYVEKVPGGEIEQLASPERHHA